MISVPFTMLLPGVALAVWAVIVAVPAVGTYVELRQVTRGGRNATVSAGRFHTTIPPERFLAFAVNAAVVTRSHAMTAMNLPGALVEMPVGVAMTHPSVWYPKDLDQWTGSLLAMPVLCLPAWWMVGLGVEALLGRRRLRWPLLLLGCVLWGMFVALLGGVVLGWTPQDPAAGGWVYAGLGLWIALFAVIPAAGLRQVMQRVGDRG
jgi:hypothetical protein